MQLIERSKTARIHEDWENDYLHSVLNTLSINLFYKKSEKNEKKLLNWRCFLIIISNQIWINQIKYFSAAKIITN